MLENWKPVHNFKVHHKREIMTEQFEELTDFQWEVIEDFSLNKLDANILLEQY